MFNLTNKAKKILKLVLSLLIIIILCFLFYYRALLSDKPLGLDTLAHLSKISYINSFGFPHWDLMWYSGSPFLKFYPPLFYCIASLFTGPFFAANFLPFLSFLLTCMGLFFVVYSYSNNFRASLVSALFFLSSLSFSFYYLAVGNLPFVFSIWTIPFVLLLFEQCIKKESRNIYFFLYNFIFLFAFLTHIFTGLCLLLILAIRIATLSGFTLKTLRSCLVFLGIPILLACFWLIPFLLKSSSFIGDEIFIPSITQILGIQPKLFFGVGGASIGLSFIAVLVAFLFIKRFKDDKIYIFLLVCSAVLFFLFLGILGKYYPSGIGSIRFVVPFSVVSSILLGVFMAKIVDKRYLFLFAFIIVILLCSLVQGYFATQNNFQKHSHASEEEEFGFVLNSFSNTNFPVQSETDFYRFGSRRPVFAKSFNFISPNFSQTSGYYDQGIPYHGSLFKFFDAVWGAGSLDEATRYLNLFAVRYFEVGGDYLKNDKFQADSRFKEVFYANLSQESSFKIYEYLSPKRLISVYYANLSEAQDPMVKISRENPDRIIIEFNFTGNEAVLFKEFYYPSWTAGEDGYNKNLNIKKTVENFMSVQPSKGASEVIFYQKNTLDILIGYSFSLMTLTLILTVLIFGKRGIIADIISFKTA